MKNLDRETKEFKEREKYAQKVIDILFQDYNDNQTKPIMSCKDYLNLLDWSIKDYESCGYDMLVYRTFFNILKRKRELLEKKCSEEN